MKIAVCVHLYHIDMWGEIQKYLDNLKHKYDLYVNFPLNIKNGIPVDLKWEEYYSLYDDLKIRLKQNQETAIQHWSKYGKNELRYLNSESNPFILFLLSGMEIAAISHDQFQCRPENHIPFPKWGC